MPPKIKSGPKKGQRDFKRELATEKRNKPKRVKQRAARNKARRKAGLKVGDPRVADHKKELSDGGSDKQSNVRVVSRKENSDKEVARKKRKARGKR
jgi:hypothetical protein